jgi:hypothetical protein
MTQDIDICVLEANETIFVVTAAEAHYQEAPFDRVVCLRAFGFGV